MITRVWPLIVFAMFSSSLPAAELQGEVHWGEPLVLSTNLDAEVVRTTVRPGQRVKKGELLVQLEDGVLRARLSQARVELSHQQLLLAEAKNELHRSEELYERTLLSDHDLDLARIAHAGAKSSYQRANTELKLAQRAIELTRIVAPFAGLIVERHHQAGETVNGQFTSVPLYSLVALDKRWVRLAVSASQVANVSVGDELELSIGEQRYTGRIDTISGQVKGLGEGRLTVDILFTPGKGRSVTIGETAQVTLP